MEANRSFLNNSLSVSFVVGNVPSAPGCCLPGEGKGCSLSGTPALLQNKRSVGGEGAAGGFCSSYIPGFTLFIAQAAELTLSKVTLLAREE